jgi:hypothetical protein
MELNPLSRVQSASARFHALLLAGAALAATGSATAASVSVATGTGAPPTALGPFTLTPFPDDPSGPFTSVSSLPSPLGGSLSFSPDVSHRTVAGGGWLTWSQGSPVGLDVYQSSSMLTLELPEQTTAFHFYAQPNLSEDPSYNITATHEDGTFLSLDVDGGGGATGFGFYVTDNSFLTSIIITADPEAQGFAIGQFQIAGPLGPGGEVPEPGTVLAGALVAAAAAFPVIRRRRHAAAAAAAAKA